MRQGEELQTYSSERGPLAGVDDHISTRPKERNNTRASDVCTAGPNYSIQQTRCNEDICIDRCYSSVATTK